MGTPHSSEGRAPPFVSASYLSISVRAQAGLKASASKTGLVGSWTIRFARIAPDHTIHALRNNGNFLSLLEALRAMVSKPYGLLSEGSVRTS